MRLAVFSKRHREALLLCAVSLCVTTAVYGQAVRTELEISEVEREGWQKVPEIFAAMGISQGSRVADVGAGSGFFTVRLARAVGQSGRVFAVDVSASAVGNLKERIARERLENVEVIASEPADPRLPNSLDAVLIVNTYHEMREHQAMLDKIRQALKLSGRLVIVDPIAQSRRHTSRAQQQSNHEIAIDYVVEDLSQAGFEILERRDRFIENLLDRDTEWLIVAKPLY
jgi:tRNA A58 N-methylase Trm61